MVIFHIVMLVYQRVGLEDLARLSIPIVAIGTPHLWPFSCGTWPLFGQSQEISLEHDWLVVLFQPL